MPCYTTRLCCIASSRKPKRRRAPTHSDSRSAIGCKLRRSVSSSAAHARWPSCSISSTRPAHGSRSSTVGSSSNCRGLGDEWRDDVSAMTSLLVASPARRTRCRLRRRRLRASSAAGRHWGSVRLSHAHRHVSCEHDVRAVIDRQQRCREIPPPPPHLLRQMQQRRLDALLERTRRNLAIDVRSLGSVST